MSDQQPLLQHAENSSEAILTDDVELPPELQTLRSNAILKAHGHNAELERSFSTRAALGLGFSITNSWVGCLSCFGQNLAYAGPNSVIFGLVAAVLVQSMISLGLYEIASCFPTSGGQYHFVFILTSAKYRRFAAFAVGWMSIFAWAVALCSGLSVVVASVLGLIAFWEPTYQATQLHSYLIYLVIALLSASPLFISPRAIPIILQATLALSLIGLVVILGLLLLLREQSLPLSSLLDLHGTSGWETRTAWLLGLGNSMYPFTSTDAAIHIAEEMQQPEKQLPQVLCMTLAIGFATSFPLLLVMMLSMVDRDAIVGSPLPYAEIFRQITQSKAITTFMVVWATLVLFSALIGIWVTCGRLAWAFARDGGLPFSPYFAQLNKHYAFPVRTTVLSLAFACVYGLLYLVSTTAFNSIITSAVLFLNISYCAPQLIVLWRGRDKVLPDHPWNLGFFGRFCNVASPIAVVLLAVLVCFPPELPVTKYNINYTPAILVGFFLAVTVAWFVGGKNFEGPKIDWEVLKNIKVK